MEGTFISQLKDLGIGVAAILGILYVFLKILTLLIDKNKEIFDTMATERTEMGSERRQNQEWFMGFVNENNHQKSEMVAEHTRAVTEVSKNIESNTRAMERHTEVIEKLVDKLSNR